MSFKILITPRSFSQNSDEPRNTLIDKGYELIDNPYGRIMTEEEIGKLVEDVDGIILGVEPFSKSVMERAKKLKVISRYGVGTDNIDLDYAREREIRVFRTVGANTDAVAEYAFGLMLDLARKITYIDKQCHTGNWQKIKTTEINKKTLGLIGFGAIGRTVAKRASGFEMHVIAFDPYADADAAVEMGVKLVDLDTLYRASDFISLHLPLTMDTKDLINEAAFAKMKQTAIFVNTARGGVVNEQALYTALKSGQIAGAGIDVFETEPPAIPEMLELDNLVVGAHCAASTLEAIDNMSSMAVENLINGLSERSLVNG